MIWVGGGVGYDGLNDEYEWNHSQIGKFVGVELAGEFGEDQAWREDHGVEFGEELLAVGIEHARDGDQVAGQGDKHDFEDGLGYQTRQMHEVGM